MLIECFVAITTDDCEDASENTVVLNWWAYSDETNSNWPDDDAKARAGELFVNLTTDESQMITNEEISAEWQMIIAMKLKTCYLWLASLGN